MMSTFGSQIFLAPRAITRLRNGVRTLADSKSGNQLRSLHSEPKHDEKDGNRDARSKSCCLVGDVMSSGTDWLHAARSFSVSTSRTVTGIGRVRYP